MKLFFLLAIISINFVPIESDVKTDILSDFDNLKKHLILNLNTSKDAVIRSYIKLGKEFINDNEALKHELIDPVTKISEPAGKELLKIFYNSQKSLADFFQFSNFNEIFKENFQEVLDYLKSSLDNEIDEFISETSFEATLRTCWNLNKKEIEKFIDVFVSDCSAVLATGPVNIPDSLSAMKAQSNAILKQRAGMFNRLRGNARKVYSCSGTKSLLTNQLQNGEKAVSKLFTSSVIDIIDQAANIAVFAIDDIETLGKKLQNCLAGST